MNKEILSFLNQDFEHFDAAISETKIFVKKRYPSLYRSGNDIIQQLNYLEEQALKFIIGNYAAFSQDAIHMLVDAMIRCHDWPLLFEELQENINEEKGSETKGIPHLEIMREGYRKDLGLEVDFQYFKVSLITKRFLHSMRLIFNNDDNAFVAGALMAFEGTAIEEFYIIDLIIKKYLEQVNHSEPLKELPQSLTKYYIDGHKIFEIGHEAHLISSIKPYIDTKNISRMVRGYLATALTMHTWWLELYHEAQFNSNYNLLQNFKQELTSVQKNIFKN